MNPFVVMAFAALTVAAPMIARPAGTTADLSDPGRASTDSIRAADYPRAAHRIVGFEARVNSADPADRRLALAEMGTDWPIPVDDHVRLLRRMVHDPDPTVAGRAIYDLSALWLAPPPVELPVRFESWSAGRGGWEATITFFDATAPESLRAAEARLELGGVVGGEASYVVGLMRDRAAIPRLRRLLDDENPYTRYAAMKALAECGDETSALRYLTSRRATDGNGDDYFAILGAQALARLGRRREGIERLTSVIRRLGPSQDDNDRGRCSFTRLMLWSLTGNDSVWSNGAPAPQAIPVSSFPRITDILPAFKQRFESPDPVERRDALVLLTAGGGLPDAELARFLRLLLHDPDPGVAGRAIIELTRIGSPPDTNEVPRRFEGSGGVRGSGARYDTLDRESPKIAQWLADAGRPIDDSDYFRGEFQGQLVGETFYLVAVLGFRPALPRLRKMLSDEQTPDRLGVVAAMARCGAVEEARAACIEDSTWHGSDKAAAVHACQLLYRLGATSTAASRLLRVMQRLRPRDDPNDEVCLHHARLVLYEVTDRYFADTEAARAWFRTHRPVPPRATW